MIEPLEPRQLLTTYYLSAAGNDTFAGTSLAAAWKTTAKLNSATLRAGDTVFLRSGDTFNGGLALGSNESGTASAPITFNSTGTTRANIVSTGIGFDASEVGGVVIKNLNFTGPGSTSNFNGIWFHQTKKRAKVSFIRVDNVNVSGYGYYGVRLEAKGMKSGYNDARITYSKLFNNGIGGFGITGRAHNVNTQIYVGHVNAYDNPGRADFTGVTGNGIFLADTDNATIERCVVYNNGANGVAPVGVWIAGSRRVVIQNNESYANKTRTTTDGGGFDIDWDNSDCVVQYNYSHDNYGPGYAMAHHATSTYYGRNTIRFNISQNDGRRNGRGAIHLYGQIVDAQVYNNVVFMSPAGSNDSAAFRSHNQGAETAFPKNVSVRNNIFYTTGGVKLLNIAAAVAPGFTFQANDYFSGGSGFDINFAGVDYTSLSSFINARGQEKLNGVIVGRSDDPMLTAAGAGGTLNNADNLATLSAYKLLASSPLINKGLVPLSSVPTSPINTDFYGDVVPRNGAYDMGADEF